MKFTFIIPTYKCHNLIRQAIESALVREGIELEIIVVDDALADGTVEWLPQACPNLNSTQISFIKCYLVEVLFEWGCCFHQHKQFGEMIGKPLLSLRYGREAQNKAVLLKLYLQALIFGQRADQ
jgi:hypothetical protein